MCSREAYCLPYEWVSSLLYTSARVMCSREAHIHPYAHIYICSLLTADMEWCVAHIFVVVLAVDHYMCTVCVYIYSSGAGSDGRARGRACRAPPHSDPWNSWPGSTAFMLYIKKMLQKKKTTGRSLKLLTRFAAFMLCLCLLVPKYLTFST